MSNSNRSYVKTIPTGDDIVSVSSEEILHFLKLVGYKAEQLKNFTNFRGKKIKVTGNLSLKGTPIETLGNIEYIDGSLDLANTKIRSLGNVKTKAYLNYSNTPFEQFEMKQEIQKRKNHAQSLREENEWEIGNSKEGDMAHAVLKTIENDFDYKIKEEGDDERLIYLKNYLETLEKEQENKTETGEDLTDLFAEIETTQDEIDELEEKIDVYDLFVSHTIYRGRILEFQLNEYGFIKKNIEMMVGSNEDMEELTKERIEENIGEYDNEFFENYIDEDKVADYFKDYFEDDIRNNPEIYFDDSDFALTDEQEVYVNQLAEKIEELETQQENLNKEIEDPDEYSKKYDEIQKQIDDLESKKDKIESNREPTEEMIEDKLDDMLSSVRRSPLYYIREHGQSAREFVDFDDIVNDIFRQDGYTYISSYDGSWDEHKVGDEYYIVVRIN